MAITACPSCNKPISSRSNLCPHCGFERGEVAQEQLQEFRRRKLRDRIYHLKMYSYIALTVLLVAFGWYIMDTSGFQHRSSTGPYLLFAAGGLCYAVIRGYLYKARADLRKIGL
ncbi:MAG: zinc ribbon domain-containing protein [Lysobacterales bacterium]|jgi:hypothetical protein